MRKNILLTSFLFLTIFAFFTPVAAAGEEFTLVINEYQSSVDDGPWQLYPTDTGIKLPVSAKPELPVHSYRFITTFQLPAEAEKLPLALRTGMASFPFELYINGMLIERHGRIDENQVDNRWQPVISTLDNKLLKFGGMENKMEIRVWTVFQTTPLFDVSIRDYQNAVKSGFTQTFLSSSLVKSAGVFAIIIFFYFIYLFFLQNRSESKYLFMALFSLSYTIIYINMTFNHPANQAFFLEKLSRMSFPFAISFLVLFMMKHTAIFSDKARKALSIGVLSLAGVFSLITFLMPSFTAVTKFFIITMNGFLAPCLLFSMTLAVIAVIRQKNRNSIIILIGFIVLLASSIHDIYYATVGTNPYIFLVVYGYMALIIAFFFVLAGEQAQIYQLAKMHSTDLNEKNERLKIVMDKISEVSGKVLDYTQKVENITIESLRIMQTFEEGNRNIESHINERFGSMQTTIEQMSESLDLSVNTIAEALGTQNNMVNDVSENIGTINERVEVVYSRASESEEIARNLSDIAMTSTDKADQSTSAVENIQQLSQFIKDVLQSINDIAEETNVLSINASIEAARAGSQGRGFKVVADNIRGLATQSQNIVSNSFKNLQEIDDLVQNSREATTSLGAVLTKIKADTRTSADIIGNINEEISSQKTEFSRILQSVRNLSHESKKINDLSVRDRQEKEQHIKSFTMMKDSFQSISVQLNSQLKEGEYLRQHLDQLRDLMMDTSKAAEDLHSLLKEDA